MKKGMIFLTVLMVLSMFLSGCNSMAGPTAPTSTSGGGSSITVGSVIMEVVTFGWLARIGVTTVTLDPFEGFIRFLMFIVLALLLFKGAKTVGMSDGISIALTLIISLIVVIFTPGTVLLAAGASSSLIFSVLILGAPLALIIGGYFMLKDHPWLRAALAALLMFVVASTQNQMNSWIATVHFTAVKDTVVGLMDYVWWAALIFGVLSILQGLSAFFSGRAAGEMDTLGTASHWWNKFQNKSRRQKTADMNQYIEDRKEMEKVEDSEKKLQHARGLVSAVQGSGQVANASEGNNVVKAVDAVSTAVKGAKGEMRRVRTRTRRAQKRYHNAMAQLKKNKKVIQDKQKEISELEVLENTILEKHDEVEQALETALSVCNGALKAHNSAFKTLVTGITAALPVPTTGSSKITVAVKGLVKELADGATLSTAIQNAKAAEKSALASMSGAQVEIQELLKWDPKPNEA